MVLFYTPPPLYDSRQREVEPAAQRHMVDGRLCRIAALAKNSGAMYWMMMKFCETKVHPFDTPSTGNVGEMWYRPCRRAYEDCWALR